MSEEISAERANTSFYKDFFEIAFEAADLTSLWWQPVLKGVGRTQLEFAGLQAKTMQSTLAWTRALTTARQPADIVSAHMALCHAVVSHCSDVMPRVSSAINDAAEPVVAFQLLQLPVRRDRDTLVIDDADAYATQTNRRVA